MFCWIHSRFNNGPMIYVDFRSNVWFPMSSALEPRVGWGINRTVELGSPRLEPLGFLVEVWIRQAVRQLWLKFVTVVFFIVTLCLIFYCFFLDNWENNICKEEIFQRYMAGMYNRAKKTVLLVHYFAPSRKKYRKHNCIRNVYQEFDSRSIICGPAMYRQIVLKHRSSCWHISRRACLYLIQKSLLNSFRTVCIKSQYDSYYFKRLVPALW